MTSRSSAAEWRARGERLRRSGVPLYRAIAEALEEDVAAGRLLGGDRLPTQRALARLLGTTVATVTRAYALAARRGRVSREVGRGTFVRAARDPRTAFDVRSEPSAAIDLLSCPPLEPAQLENSRIAAALCSVAARRDLGALLRGVAPGGTALQRASGARWLAGAGLPFAPERLLFTAGAQHALALVLSTLLRPGDALLCEALTYPGLKALAAAMQLELVPVAIDADGILPAALDRAAARSRARALYAIPTVHPATTGTLPRARRQEIAAVLCRRDLLVIEDDDDAWLCAPRPVPLAALEPERAFFVGDASKGIAPGLRAACLLAPARFVAALEDGIRRSVFLTAPLAIATACELADSGAAAKLAAARRAEARLRQQLARSLLPDRGSALRPRTRQGAHHVWLPLASACRSDVLAAQAAEDGVLVAPASTFAVGGGGPPALRISLSGEATRERLAEGVRRLARLL